MAPPSPEPGAGSGPRTGTARAGVLRGAKAAGGSETSDGSEPVLTPRLCPTRTPRPPQGHGEGRFGGVRERGSAPERSGKLVSSSGKSDQGSVDHTGGKMGKKIGKK